MSFSLQSRCLRALAGVAVLGFLVSALVPAAALAQAQAPAQAPAQNGQIFQDWALRCQKNPQNPAIEVCFIAHAAIDSGTQKPVMQMEVARVGEEKVPLAVITVPLRVRLPAGIRLQIDAGQPMTIPYELCDPEGCKARFKLDEPILGSFKKGTGGKIAVLWPPAKEIEIPFSLKGFTAAFAALK